MPGMADTDRPNEHGADAAAESTLVRAHFVSTAAACVGLVADPHVAAVWKQPSVLADFSVGALAGHLTRGILQVEWFLDNEVPDAVPVTAAEYYAPFADTGDLTTDRNRAVRDRGNERAALGPEAIIAETRACLGRIRDRLPSVASDRYIEALGSSGVRGRVLLLDDYLTVRLVEQTIHYDDLARSVPEAATESLNPAAYRAAIDTLIEAAVLRHGALPVLLALTRRERDTLDALRVL